MRGWDRVLVRVFSLNGILLCRRTTQTKTIPHSLLIAIKKRIHYLLIGWWNNRIRHCSSLKRFNMSGYVTTRAISKQSLSKFGRWIQNGHRIKNGRPWVQVAEFAGIYQFKIHSQAYEAGTAASHSLRLGNIFVTFGPKTLVNAMRNLLQAYHGRVGRLPTVYAFEPYASETV